MPQPLRVDRLVASSMYGLCNWEYERHSSTALDLCAVGHPRISPDQDDSESLDGLHFGLHTYRGSYGALSRIESGPESQAAFCRSATFANAIDSAAPPKVFTRVVC